MANINNKRITLKILLFVILTLVIIFLFAITVFFVITANVKLDKDKFINFNKSIVFYDIDGNEILTENDSVETTIYENLPQNLINAFISIEDKRFFTHKGIDFKGMIRATFNNVRSFSFKEGASTISQQLIKNTHLSNKKTIKRKLSEMKLAKELEKEYSKKQILEMYLNTIYFGENCFGITKASSFYFNKLPKDLSLNECAMLAGLVKAPSNYSPLNNFEKCNKRKNVVLKEMFNQKYISEQEFKNNSNSKIKLNLNNSQSKFNYFTLVKKELSGILEDKNIYIDNIKVYTNYSPKIQKDLEESFNDFKTNYNKSAIIMDKNSKILAYKSNCRELNHQIGSCIKPIIAYAPAVELNQIEEYSLFLDEKTNFNGYKPSNYADKYYGYITAKDALSKSSNVVSLKILQDVGIEKAKEFVNKTDIHLTENDNSLCIGLGATEKGASLKELTSAYSVFVNDGYYKKAYCINSIQDEFGNKIYFNNYCAKKIFEKDTTFIVNEMLKETVLTGTAKNLKNNIPLYAKTGTVGSEKGNTDAYTISFNRDYIVGAWFGSDKIMENSITGGGYPCRLSNNIWKKIYIKQNAPDYFNAPYGVNKIIVDKLSFEDEHVIEIAEDYTPKKYTLQFYSKNNSLIKKISSRFSSPRIKNIKSSVNSKGITLELCLTKPANAMIYKTGISDKTLVFDTKKNNTNIFFDDIISNKFNTYIIVPYVEINGKKITGKNEIITIKKDNDLNGEFWKE